MNGVQVKEEVPIKDTEDGHAEKESVPLCGITVKEEPEDFSSLDTVPYDEITIKTEKIEPYITSDDNATDTESVPMSESPDKTLARLFDENINWFPRVHLVKLPLSYLKRLKEACSSDEDEPPSKQMCVRNGRSIKKPSRFNSQEFGTYEELIAIQKSMKIAKAFEREIKSSSKSPKSVGEGSASNDETHFSEFMYEDLFDLDDNIENFDDNPKPVGKKSPSFIKTTQSSDKSSTRLDKRMKSFHKSSKSSHKTSSRKMSSHRTSSEKSFEKSFEKSLKPSKRPSSKKPKGFNKKSRRKGVGSYDEGIDSSNDDAISLDLDSDDDGPIVMNDLDYLDGLKGNGYDDAISLGSEESSEEETEDCNDCKVAWEGDCPKHGALVVVKDLKVISQNVHSMMTVPPQVYIGTWGGYRVADNPNNGRGVFAKKNLPSRMRFGPLQGKIVSPDTPETWLIRKNGKPFRGIDVSSPGTSNWMRYVKVSRNEAEVNCDAYQYQGLIFFKTIRGISPQEELVVGAYDYNGFLLKQGEDSDSLPDEVLWGSGLYDIIPMKDNEDPDMDEMLCTICFESFTTKTELEEHVESHVTDKPFGCSQCNKRFADQPKLMVHERSHSSKVQKNKDGFLACPDCNKLFASKSGLRKHSRLHTGEKLTAKKPSGEKHVVKKHAVKKHTHEKHDAKDLVEKMLSCPICRSKFSSQSLLDSHSQASGDGKPFECMVCSKRFKIQCGLNKHMHIHSCC